MSKLTSKADLERLRQEILEGRKGIKRTIVLCSGTGCLASHSAELSQAFAQAITARRLNDTVALRLTGCHGFCERGPVVLIEPERICYLQVRREDAQEIVEETLMRRKVVQRLVYHDEASGRALTTLDEIPFYRHQRRHLLEQNTLVDPRSLEDYIAHWGYSALAKALLTMRPEEVLDTVKRSGLRGRGGGGFPTGDKWEATRRAEGSPKYVIVNADEGDPGAYMDRSLLEGNPHSVIEGLAIGAYAMGASEGYIYVRQEYPLAVKNTRIALAAARERGLLGQNILGSAFSFDVRVHQGAGAFVSGESSALMSAIEGKVGRPRPKYIHTSEKGLFDRPTNLNNVETWANVPQIISSGAEWFRSMGTEGSKGTKIFSLVGKVRNTGLVEVPMGTTLRRIVFDIGGGIPGGKVFKAVQTGGPSGGFLPEESLDLPVDFDVLSEAGSMMGSGGMIVMDEGSCMVNAARYYVDFLAHESCGTCAPCREGLRQMRRILNNICQGQGLEGDVELLLELSDLMEGASLCALGQTAVNPLLSAIRYFRGEFDAHIREKRCPAGVCQALIQYRIEAERCSGCGICVKECPTQAIEGVRKGLHSIVQERCIKCGNCLKVCPERFQAVVKVSGQVHEAMACPQGPSGKAPRLMS